MLQTTLLIGQLLVSVVNQNDGNKSNVVLVWILCFGAQRSQWEGHTHIHTRFHAYIHTHPQTEACQCWVCLQWLCLTSSGERQIWVDIYDLWSFFLFVAQEWCQWVFSKDSPHCGMWVCVSRTESAGMIWALLTLTQSVCSCWSRKDLRVRIQM